jgi:sialate O-acetylesterase
MVQEAQVKALELTNTAMVVSADICFGNHPPVKEPLGERLALAAEAIAYGRKIEYSGPLYKSMKVEGDKIRLFFDHGGGGLIAKEDLPLDYAEGGKGVFMIAGKDGKYVPAKAVIDKDTVVVSAPAVPEPAGVRYGFDLMKLTLFNKEKLPAAPFRAAPP